MAKRGYESRDKIDYAITSMANGFRRAECHAPGCDWWKDYRTFNNAEIDLRSHVGVHPDITWDPRRAEIRQGLEERA